MFKIDKILSILKISKIPSILTKNLAKIYKISSISKNLPCWATTYLRPYLFSAVTPCTDTLFLEIPHHHHRSHLELHGLEYRVLSANTGILQIQSRFDWFPLHRLSESVDRAMISISYLYPIVDSELEPSENMKNQHIHRNLTEIRQNL